MKKFTREELINSPSMEFLKLYGNESGKRLYDIILDAYDNGICDESETPEELIKICAQVFNNLEIMYEKN